MLGFVIGILCGATELFLLQRTIKRRAQRAVRKGRASDYAQNGGTDRVACLCGPLRTAGPRLVRHWDCRRINRRLCHFVLKKSWYERR